MGLTLAFSLQGAFLTPLCLLPQGSLSCHAPKDQAYSQILEHVYSQLSWATHTECTWILLPLRFGPSTAGMKRLVFDQETCLHKKKHTVDALNFSTPVQSLTSKPLYLELRKHIIHFWSSESVILVGCVYQWGPKSDGTDAGEGQANRKIKSNNLQTVTEAFNWRKITLPVCPLIFFT